jgi:hypothetical protein
MASAMEADTGDNAAGSNEGTETGVSGVAGSDLTAKPSSGIIVENLKPALLAVLGVGRKSSLLGLILVLNGGGGARLLLGKGPGEEAVLLMPDVVSIWKGDAVRLPGLFNWPVADLLDVRRSSAAMPFAIGDEGLGGRSDGNRACSCSRRTLFRASFWGVSDIWDSRWGWLTTGTDLMHHMNRERIEEGIFQSTTRAFTTGSGWLTTKNLTRRKKLGWGNEQRNKGRMFNTYQHSLWTLYNCGYIFAFP